MQSSHFLTLDPNDLEQPKLHHYLLGAVAPRPIALASTIDKEGNMNLSPFSFFNVFSSNPPIMIFSPARRGTDNTAKHTLGNVLEVPEVVINIVNYPIVEQMSLSSTNYPKGVNEFLKSGFTAIPSDKVQPPRVGESPVSFECKVEQVTELGKSGGAGNLVICKVVNIHIHKDCLDNKNKIDTHKMDLVARMGGPWYNRATGSSLFKIPKPLSTRGIGVDALSDEIRNSKILTGNDLGRLGNLEELPTLTQIKNARVTVENEQLTSKEKIHNYARQLIRTDRAAEALAFLSI